MAQELVMPRLSDTMEEGTIARWLKQEGEAVQKGEAVVEIETDKATVELPAYRAGVLRKILVPAGQTVALGAPIGVLAGVDEPETAEPASGALAAADGAPAESATAAAAGAATEGEPDQPARPTNEDTAGESDDAAPASEEREGAADGAAGAATAPREPRPATAQNGGPGDAPPPARAGSGVEARPESARPTEEAAPLRATPVARRLAEEHGLDLTALAGQGSGPGGRIVELDVQRVLGERGGAPAEDGAGTGGAPAEDGARAGGAADVEPRPVGRIHQLMAERTTQSVREIPQYYLTSEIDMAAALALRRELRAALGDEGAVSINDLILRATALALRAVPEVNSTWRDGQLALHRHVHLGIAVAVPDGLVVPVIRDADRKMLREIAAEARTLAARAREGRLRPGELQGSTFTVSNLGMLDVEEFRGIINPPEAGLLAVGAVVERPVGEEGQIVLRPRLRVTLTADHRAYSGDVGARFLQALKRLLQEPLRLGY